MIFREQILELDKNFYKQNDALAELDVGSLNYMKIT